MKPVVHRKKRAIPALCCRFCAFLVIADLTGRAFLTAGSAVVRIVLEINLASVGKGLVAVGIVRLAARERTFPAGA